MATDVSQEPVDGSVMVISTQTRQDATVPDHRQVIVNRMFGDILFPKHGTGLLDAAPIQAVQHTTCTYEVPPSPFSTDTDSTPTIYL
jgi:hypothetical protein